MLAVHQKRVQHRNSGCWLIKAGVSPRTKFGRQLEAAGGQTPRNARKEGLRVTLMMLYRPSVIGSQPMGRRVPDHPPTVELPVL